MWGRELIWPNNTIRSTSGSKNRQPNCQWPQSDWRPILESGYATPKPLCWTSRRLTVASVCTFLGDGEASPPWLPKFSHSTFLSNHFGKRQMCKTTWGLNLIWEGFVRQFLYFCVLQSPIKRQISCIKSSGLWWFLLHHIFPWARWRLRHLRQGCSPTGKICISLSLSKYTHIYKSIIIHNPMYFSCSRSPQFPQGNRPELIFEKITQCGEVLQNLSEWINHISHIW